MKPKAIIGLGNPPSYIKTKHSVGQLFLNFLTKSFSYSKKLQGEIAELNGTLLYKPSCYMNLTGHSTKKAMKELNLSPEDILIAHDELDLEPGRFKVKHGGSANGHNGLLSVISQIGTNECARLRIGIVRHDYEAVVPSYVLSEWEPFELELLHEQVFPKAMDLLLVKQNYS